MRSRSSTLAMPHPGLLLVPALLLASAGCRKSEPAALDCREDFDCLLRRAQACQPASALLRQQYTVEGKASQVLARYEVVGRVSGQCHVRRTQLEPPPPPPPDAGPETEYELTGRPRELPPPPYPRPGVLPPPLLQCLYPEAQLPEVLRRARQSASTQEDLDPCYPGDGSCEDLPVPLLGPGCVLGDCLAGRWTFTCEDYKDPRLPIYLCEGTRLSDENPHCFLFCKRDGQFELGCRKPWHPKPGQEKRPDLAALLDAGTRAR